MKTQSQKERNKHNFICGINKFTQVSPKKKDIMSHAYASKIQTIFKNLEVEGKIVQINSGPCVFSFLWKFKNEQIPSENLAHYQQEISLAFEGAPVRIILSDKNPEFTTIEVALPSTSSDGFWVRELIKLEDILNSEKFYDSNLKLPIAMGVDTRGEPIVSDLAILKNLLVAGDSFGKSVFLESVITSLFYNFSPDKLKIVITDFNGDLEQFNNLPHLLTPIIDTDEKAVTAFDSICNEMKKRRLLLEKVGAFDIVTFNKIINSLSPEEIKSIKKEFSIPEYKSLELPYLVIAIDEITHLANINFGSIVKNQICELLSERVSDLGIHLIVLSRRSLLDPILNLINIKIPNRVCFKTKYSFDSMSILGTYDASNIGFYGDMIFKRGNVLSRVHPAMNLDELESDILIDLMTKFYQLESE